jgi:hypothetical protein
LLVSDGEGDLELFLDHFDKLADYYAWIEPQRLSRLRQCIRGDAQYMPTVIRNVTSNTSFVDLLRQRLRIKVSPRTLSSGNKSPQDWHDDI